MHTKVRLNLKIPPNICSGCFFLIYQTFCNQIRLTLLRLSAHEIVSLFTLEVKKDIRPFAAILVGALGFRRNEGKMTFHILSMQQACKIISKWLYCIEKGVNLFCSDTTLEWVYIFFSIFTVIFHSEWPKLITAEIWPWQNISMMYEQ